MWDGFIDHGVWERYRPDPIPEGVPKSAMFAHRVTDGLDWYEHVYSGTNFQPTSVKFTVATIQPTEEIPYAYTIIQASAVDTTMLFPSDYMKIIEMPGSYESYTPKELNDAFASKMINLDTGEITNPPASASLQKTVATSTLVNLMKRVEELERKYGVLAGN